MAGRLVVLILALLASLGGLALASSSSTLGVSGLRNGPLVVTLPDVASVTTATRLAVDDTSHGVHGKRAAVYLVTVGGEPCYLLVRAQVLARGVFVDLLAAPSLEALETASGGMDLAALTPGHPSPEEDAADAAVLAAAGE